MCEVASPENDDVIETLSTNASRITLARGIHQRSPHYRSQYFHSGTLRHSVEFSTELVVVIANDHIETRAERRDITKLLHRPLFRWCSRNPNANDFAGLDVDHEESEQRPKPNIVDLQEISGPNRVVCEKRLPVLPMQQRRRTHFPHVPLNRTFGDGDPELENLTSDVNGLWLLAESFFGAIKQELIYRCVFTTRDAARQAIFDYIEVFYNRRRLHSSIGYMSPIEFELANFQANAA